MKNFKKVKDRRQKKRIKASSVLTMIFLLYLFNLKSLNQLEEKSNLIKLKNIESDEIPSVDSDGRISALIELDDIRKILSNTYKRLHRMKIFKCKSIGIIDGHEKTKSNHRKCKYCSVRKVNLKNNKFVFEYYHRYAYFMISNNGYNYLIDIEPILPGEDEVKAACRMSRRVLKNYPGAFNILLGDALYLRENVFSLMDSYKKYAIVVLKDKRRNLYKDVMGIKKISGSLNYKEKSKNYKVWDFEKLGTWPSYKKEVRVLISEEEKTYRVHTSDYQKSKKKWIEKTEKTTWAWCTNIPSDKLETKLFVKYAHKRWEIENQGFNNFKSEYDFDHVCHHNQNSILVFSLILFLVDIILQVFRKRNLKNDISKKTKKYFVDILLSVFIIEGKCLEYFDTG